MPTATNSFIFSALLLCLTTGCYDSELGTEIQAHRLHDQILQGDYASMLHSKIVRRGETYRISWAPENVPCLVPDSVRIWEWVLVTQREPLTVAYLGEFEHRSKLVKDNVRKYAKLHGTSEHLAHTQLLAQLQAIAVEFNSADISAVTCRNTGSVLLYVTPSHVLSNSPPTEWTRTSAVEEWTEGWFYYKLAEPVDFGG